MVDQILVSVLTPTESLGQSPKESEGTCVQSAGYADGTKGRFMSGWWTLFKETAASWSNHKDARLGAALAYYSVFSIGPLILIAQR